MNVKLFLFFYEIFLILHKKGRDNMRLTPCVSSAICIPDTSYFICFFICFFIFFLCSVPNPANPLTGPPGRDGPAGCTGNIC